jgi:hypothetical protein
MNYPAAELTGYQTALTALFFEAKLRGIHPKGLKQFKNMSLAEPQRAQKVQWASPDKGRRSPSMSWAEVKRI